MPELPPSPFRHIALNVDKETQAELERRIEAAGLEGGFTLEHGYCRSVYVTDPNGMIVEFTCDDPRAAAGDAERKAKAHAELKRWLAGDHTSNNELPPRRTANRRLSSAAEGAGPPTQPAFVLR
jgi:glyoxylase I family protein